MKNYTDINQSKELAKKFPIETSDSHYVRKVRDFMGNKIDTEWSHPKYGNPLSKHANYLVQNFTEYETLPCWSLGALLSLIKSYNGCTYKIVGTLDGGAMISFEDVTCVAYQESEILDAVYEMVMWLNEN